MHSKKYGVNNGGWKPRFWRCSGVEKRLTLAPIEKKFCGIQVLLSCSISEKLKAQDGPPNRLAIMLKRLEFRRTGLKGRKSRACFLLSNTILGLSEMPLFDQTGVHEIPFF